MYKRRSGADWFFLRAVSLLLCAAMVLALGASRTSNPDRPISLNEDDVPVEESDESVQPEEPDGAGESPVPQDPEEPNETERSEEAGEAEEPTADENTSEESEQELIPGIRSEYLAGNEAIVMNYQELRAALNSDNGITTVYLGANIDMQLGGVRIHPNKTNVVIAGINPYDSEQAAPFTLTDYNSMAFTSTIYVDAKGPKSILVRDLNIIGKNYYGPVSIIDAAAQSALTLTYQRVSYSGPQFGYHRQGTMRVVDCSIEIHGGNGVSPNQEFSEVKHLIFSGTNYISTASSSFSVFLHPLGGSLTVADGASLYLHSPSTSTLYGIFYADAAANKVSISVGTHAVFDINLSGALTTSYASINALNVGDGGAFRLTTTKMAAIAPLTMNGPITVGRQSRFIITGYGGASYSLLEQKSGDITVRQNATFHLIANNAYARLLNMSGGTLHFDDPESVLLYNSNRPIQATDMAGRIGIDAEQVNYWNTLSSGGLDYKPLYGWKQANGSNLNIQATLNTGASGDLSSLTSNYEKTSPTDTEINTTSFSMAKARVLSIGRLAISAAAPTAGSTVLSGVTAPGAAVRISFTQGDTDYTINDTASSTGVFKLNLGVALNVLTVIQIESSWQYLYASSQVVVGGGGALEFHVPQQMEFVPTVLSTEERWIRRVDDNWSIAVSDTRESAEGWSLYARLAQPLTPANSANAILYDALIFVDENGAAQPLRTTENQRIFNAEGTMGQGITIVEWSADRGILIDPPLTRVRAGVYTSVIEWTLLDVP